MPKILCVNPDNICPNRPGGRSGRGNSQDASDVCDWPVAVPTRIVATDLFTFDTGVSGVKYYPLTPKSTISISCLASLVSIHMANLRSHFREILLLLSFLSGGPCQEQRHRNLPKIMFRLQRWRTFHAFGAYAVSQCRNTSWKHNLLSLPRWPGWGVQLEVPPP